MLISNKEIVSRKTISFPGGLNHVWWLNNATEEGYDVMWVKHTALGQQAFLKPLSEINIDRRKV